MQEIKDTQRAEVRIGFDGRVHKRYKGQLAKERFTNEIRVLRYLESKGCNFVPQLLEASEEDLSIVTTNCGTIVHKISPDKEKAIFDELESFGVKHEDAFTRNITYNARMGRFCVIDFEFALILESGEGLTLKDAEAARKGNYERQADG